jgi:NAD(P)-dependent dehydrogenase (short-subunit alcohol dehydrogenase family)
MSPGSRIWPPRWTSAVDAFGSLTILVNNAGGGGPKPFDMPMADMRLAFELNLFSVFRLCQLAAPHMEQAGGGAILNISSMAAPTATGGWPPTPHPRPPRTT